MIDPDRPAAIEEWMPRFQVSACYSILVRASVDATFAALAQARFSNLAIVRGLMWLRGYGFGRGSPESATASIAHGRRYGEFIELAINPPREVVLGIAGRFWRPDGGMVRDLTAPEFATFARDGYAKAAWNFFLVPGDGGTKLSTETRLQTYGRFTSLKFRAYWLIVAPFSGIIRKAMLQEVKRIAEQPAT